MECLYVAQGENGLLKIGRTKDTKRRVIQLRREFKRRGDRLVRFQPCPPVDSAHGCEYSLHFRLSKTHEVHSGREWFKAGDFESVLALAIQLSDESRKNQEYWKSPAGIRRAAVEEKRLEAWQAERDLWKAESDRIHAEWMRGRDQRKAERLRRKIGPIGYIVRLLAPELSA